MKISGLGGAACRGPRLLDQCHNPLLERPDQAPQAMEEAALPLLDLLLRQLSSAAADEDGDKDLAATLAGGLAKLLMQQVLQQQGTPARIEDCETEKVWPASARQTLLQVSNACLAPVLTMCKPVA